MSNNQQIAVSDQRKNFLAKLGSDGMKKQLALAAPKHLTPDRILRIALTAFNKNPKLFECDENTILASMMDCTALGLEPDNRKAYLVPYYDKRKRILVCQLIVGYQGMIELAYRHPQVTGVRARAVYEKDDFEYDEGLHPFLKHKPTDEDDPGRLTHAYAICNIGQHGSTFVVLNRRQVMKAKQSSSSADAAWSPWNEFEEAMWVKTAVRALAKYMPSSTELTEAIQIDDRHNGRTFETGIVTNIPAGNLGGGVAGTLTEMAQSEAGQGGQGGQTTTTTVNEEKTPEKPPAETGNAPSVKSLIKTLLEKGRAENAGKGKLIETLIAMKYIPVGGDFESLNASQLSDILDAWEEVKDRIKNPEATA